LLVVDFWFPWEGRNGMRNGESLKHPKSMASKSRLILTWLRCIFANRHLLTGVNPTFFSTNGLHRRKTRFGWMNVNAALFKSAKRMGVGVMIQNHNGKCVSTCSELIQDVTAPELAEALAIRRAMTLVRRKATTRSYWRLTAFLWSIASIASLLIAHSREWSYRTSRRRLRCSILNLSLCIS
jgi:hypothetical protein